MKDVLDEESRKALIAYRMQRAYDTMKEAEVMIRETFRWQNSTHQSFNIGKYNYICGVSLQRSYAFLFWR